MSGTSKKDTFQFISIVIAAIALIFQAYVWNSSVPDMQKQIAKISETAENTAGALVSLNQNLSELRAANDKLEVLYEKIYNLDVKQNLEILYEVATLYLYYGRIEAARSIFQDIHKNYPSYRGAKEIVDVIDKFKGKPDGENQICREILNDMDIPLDMVPLGLLKQKYDKDSIKKSEYRSERMRLKDGML